jgi:hypothetical protein
MIPSEKADFTRRTLMALTAQAHRAELDHQIAGLTRVLANANGLPVSCQPTK